MPRKRTLFVTTLLLLRGADAFSLTAGKPATWDSRAARRSSSAREDGDDVTASLPPPPAGTGQRIWIAAGEGDTAALAPLLEQWSGREDVLNWSDEYGYTPLITAAFYGRLDAVRLLASTPGVDLQRGDGGDMSALLAAAYFGRTDVAAELLRHVGLPEDVNRVDAFGFSALHYACREGHVDIVCMLLSCPGIDPNLRCTEVGMTPLACAAFNGRAAVVALLLSESGVDVDARATAGSWAGRTALHFAQAAFCEEAAELIRAAGGRE